jgi:hypothetical protein
MSVTTISRAPNSRAAKMESAQPLTKTRLPASDPARTAP